CGTPKNVAISPPDAFLQSRQWQMATKSGSLSNSNVTAPQAHRPVYFLVMACLLLSDMASAPRAAVDADQQRRVRMPLSFSGHQGASALSASTTPDSVP